MTSTTTSSLWAQALTAADLEVISHSEAAAAVGGATEEGLPWSPDGVWPLPEAQVKLLAFELLLLCRPLPPSEDEMAARGGASGLLRSMSTDERRKFASRLSARLVRQLSEDEAAAASAVHGGRGGEDDEYDDDALPEMPTLLRAESDAHLASRTARVTAGTAADAAVPPRSRSGYSRATRADREAEIDDRTLVRFFPEAGRLFRYRSSVPSPLPLLVAAPQRPCVPLPPPPGRWSDITS